MIKSSSSEVIRSTNSPKSTSPSRSSLIPDSRFSLSGPWQAKQWFERIGRTSRLNDTLSVILLWAWAAHGSTLQKLAIISATICATKQVGKFKDIDHCDVGWAIRLPSNYIQLWCDRITNLIRSPTTFSNGHVCTVDCVDAATWSPTKAATESNLSSVAFCKSRR